MHKPGSIVNYGQPITMKTIKTPSHDVTHNPQT
jgi:hypothetical protein